MHTRSLLQRRPASLAVWYNGIIKANKAQRFKIKSPVPTIIPNVGVIFLIEQIPSSTLTKKKWTKFPKRIFWTSYPKSASGKSTEKNITMNKIATSQFPYKTTDDVKSKYVEENTRTKKNLFRTFEKLTRHTRKKNTQKQLFGNSVVPMALNFCWVMEHRTSNIENFDKNFS